MLHLAEHILILDVALLMLASKGASENDGIVNSKTTPMLSITQRNNDYSATARIRNERIDTVDENLDDSDDISASFRGASASIGREYSQVETDNDRANLHSYTVTERVSPNDTQSYGLVKSILKDYARHVKPVSHAYESIAVNVSGSLYQIINMEQKKNLIKISAYFELSWFDAFLKWNPLDYENTKSIFVPASLVWIPEVYMYYSVDERSTMLLTNTGLDVEIKYNGLVRYFLPFTANSLCPADVKYFPFDKQSCSLMFGSWAHTTESTVFQSIRSELYLGDFYDNQEWILTESTLRDHRVYYVTADGNHSYSAVMMTLSVQRQSFYYVFNLVLPSALITTVALIGFHVPAGSTGGRQSKYRLGIMTLLSMAVLLLSVVNDLPKFSSHAMEGRRGSFSSVPLIGLYYFSLLAMIGLSTVTSSFYVIMERYCIKHRPPIPRCFTWLAWNPSRRFAGKTYLVNSTTQDSFVTACREQQALSLDDLSMKTPFESPRELKRLEQFYDYSPIDPPSNYASLRLLQRSVAELMHALCDLRECIDKWRNSKKKPSASLDPLWEVMLYRLEMLSLVIYLLSVFVILVLFFNHDWY